MKNGTWRSGRRLLFVFVLSAPACGVDESVRAVTVSGCDLVAVRVLAFDRADACTLERPGSKGEVAQALTDSGWLNPRAAAEVRLTGSATTAVAECRDGDGIVRLWGCDDAADGRLAVAVEEVCVACDLEAGGCPGGARLWRDLCVPRCAECDDVCGSGPCGIDEVCSHDECVPGTEDEDGDGAPASSDCDDEDLAVFPGATRPCESSCAEGLETCGSDRNWGPCSAPGDCSCEPGDVRSEPCGRCGSATRGCAPDGTWGDLAACAAEGDCAPGQEGREDCTNCGTRRRTCQDDCRWGPFGGCQDRGPCTPGEEQAISCGDCGSQSRVCDDTCHWLDLGPCDEDASACEERDPRTCSHWDCVKGMCIEVLEPAGSDPAGDCEGASGCCDGAGGCAPGDCG